MESRIIAFSQAGADAARACGEGAAARFGQGAGAGRPALGWAGGAQAAGCAGHDAGGAARRRVHGVADDARSVCLVDETAVAGTRHVPGVRALVDGLAPGDELAFVRDRRNPYDPWATEVRDERGNRLGYVSCEHNEVVARLLDGGRDVAGLVGSVDQLGNWTRIQMEVRLYA
ncbi:MAG: hypothetical protein HFJ74_01535 [Eggerthellaceae bacterium]|jgi:hypothetical protein|nr:hypothetical protein [Eggerthellaceae bacterium]